MQAAISCDSVRTHASPSHTTLGSYTGNPNLIAGCLAPSTGSIAYVTGMPGHGKVQVKERVRIGGPGRQLLRSSPR
jgi:hypothetical protein